MPKTITRHDISNEELDILTINDTDRGAMWMCAGIVLGSAVPILQKCYSAFIEEPKIPLDITITIQIVISSICLALAVYIGIKTHKDRNRSQRIAIEIRSRDKR